MNEKPLVSVIVRTKDRPQLIKRALQSIADQTYRPIDTVLVNDGGCDLDIEELKTILGDVSFHYVKLEKNEGRSFAGNAGIENAKGEYIGFLDDDDEFYPKHIATLLYSLTGRNGCACTYSDSEMVRREYDDEGHIISEINKGLFKSCDFSREVLLFENYIPLMCCLFRRDHLRDLGGFDNSLQMFEDWDLFIRASEKEPFCHVSEITAKYIQWSDVHQIAFVNAPIAEESYLKVLSKHSKEMMPEVAYRYFLVKQEELAKAINIFEKEMLEEKEKRSVTEALVDALHSKNRDFEKEVAEEKEKRSAAEALADTLHSENRAFESNLRQTEQTNKELGEQIASIEMEKGEVTGRLKETQEENTQLRERLTEADTKNEELKVSLKEMQTLAKGLSSKNTHIENELSQIKGLQEELRDRQAQMQRLQEELRDRQAQMQGLQEELRDRQTQMQRLQEELRDRQAQMQGLREELRGERFKVQGLREELKDERFNMLGLQEELRDRQARMQGLQEELRDRQAQVQGLQEELRDRQAQMQDLREELEDERLKMQGLQVELRDKQFRMHELSDELLKKTIFLEEVQNGIGWTLLEYYRLNLRDRLAPAGTRRRKIYDDFLNKLKTTKKEHFRTFPADGKTGSIIKHEHFAIPKISDDAVEVSNTTVSVIIPTRNAGTEFEHVLQRIRTQKGLRDIEIIVVDSGSEDGTIALAERYHAKVFSIHPSEFGHGRTRNYGAKFAAGEYLVFLSQDAIPIGDACFLAMIRGMKNDPRIAAVSARQIPRSDADIFACWQIWHHYEKFLRYSEDEIISLDSKAIDLLEPDDKRRVAQIDNIFSCVRNDIFREFMFRELEYAEDLDLGLRLVRNGYKIGFLSSVGAIHSHNRNAMYYFKRSYIDRKALVLLLNISPIDWHAIGINSFPGLVKYIQSVYDRLDNVFHDIASGKMKDDTDTSPFDSLRHLVRIDLSNNNNAGKNKGLRCVIDDLVSISGADGTSVSLNDDIISRQFFSALESFREYLLSYAVVHDKSEEIVSALYKLCAVVLGANLGDYAAYSEAKNRENLDVELDRICGSGV